MILYHRTTSAAAHTILTSGFRDNTNTYMVAEKHTGVWLSNVPLDANEGAWGDVLLKVMLALPEKDIAQYEWIEEGKGYREWLLPADLINREGAVEVAERDVVPDWVTTP